MKDKFYEQTVEFNKSRWEMGSYYSIEYGLQALCMWPGLIVCGYIIHQPVQGWIELSCDNSKQNSFIITKLDNNDFDTY